ncbi:HBL229Cp [Eremothecium sinecaudum]|uniref:HBL229Cp n=1 Tax=Eremothecium sinecaudum TaxID=45286 RepID=A0A109UW67_9SACH|nr:HBL229Cp [Eremothecium sinecaudum]AMD18673.1 HBL229Cp [Eremothecium sinecaudum]
MSASNISRIKYLNPKDLYRWIKIGHVDREPFQVIDVRGSDYIGGHISGSWNYPYGRIKREPELLNELKSKLEEKLPGEGQKSVVHCVFHCAQSQQRGPSTAMRFLRSIPEDQLHLFEIWILRGGFNEWQSMYGQDSSVTQDYVPDLW